MALAWEDLGEYKKAEAYYKKAMDIMEALRPGSLLEIAVTWVNLAVLYEKAGRDGEIGNGGGDLPLRRGYQRRILCV